MLSNMSVRAERKRQTRAELLRAARTVIAAKGFTATTARDVALEAGVAVGTVFVHFPTMAVLAEELLDETIVPALDSAVRTMPEQAGLVDRLVHVSLVLYQAYDADAELSRQVLAASLFESSPGSTSQRRIADFQVWVVRQVDAAVEAGEIAPISGEEAFAGFFALYFAVLVAGLRGDLDAESRPVLLRSLLGRLLRPTSGS